MAVRSKAMQGLARRVMAPHGMLPARSGGGGPVALGRPPNRPLPEEDELLWDDGSAYPEYCLDRFELVSKWEALGWLAGGFGVFAGIGMLARLNNKAASVPFAPREYPYNNLAKELGRDQD
eukprot:jgi/Astpho2/3677/Aster-04868